MKAEGLSATDAALLAAVRGALARPFADPVAVLDLPLSRRAARAIERELASSGLTPSLAAQRFSADRRGRGDG